MEQIICEKFDPNKCHKDMSIDEVILSQFDIDINECEAGSIDVTKLYMPDEEQEKMREWMMKNIKSLKRLPKKLAERQMEWIELDIFPSSIRKEDK